jgi:hypothetical protein
MLDDFFDRLNDLIDDELEKGGMLSSIISDMELKLMALREQEEADNSDA